jgi:hypothetical protein
VFCGEPPTVPNAQSNLMRNQKHHVFRVGEIATYSCDQGFVRVSGEEQTQCIAREEQRNAQWEPIDLICESMCLSNIFSYYNLYKKLLLLNRKPIL